MKKGASPIAFLFFWIFVNTMGWFVFDIFGYYLALAVFGIGLLLAALQFMVLKHYFELDDLTWIWFSFLPYGISYALMVSKEQQQNMNQLFFWILILFAVAGYLQWRSLSFYLRNAGIWLIASPVAGCVSLWAAFTVIGLGLTRSPFGIFQVVLGLTYGMLTGLAILVADKLPVSKASVRSS